MTTYNNQRWLFAQARKRGWPGREPDVLGTPEAEAAFREAKQFLIDLGISYAQASIWFSGTCKECGVWSGTWRDHDTRHMQCPECGAIQSVTALSLHEDRKRRSQLSRIEAL